MTLRFVHTSDIHLLDLRGVRPWSYFNKRITGRLNLALHRGRKHDGHLFDALAARLETLDVDRLVVTGDLSNLAFAAELELCRRKFDALPVPVTVIPGNHDAYVKSVTRDRVFERIMAPHMQGEREDDEPYPFMLREQGVAFIGLSTAIPTPPFVASGRLGAGQLERLARMLDRAAHERLVRVVLIHHPPVPGISKARHALLDLEAFGDVVARHGAELVLHGHEHVCIETRLPGPHADIPVHGIASGTSVSMKPERRASFSVYEVSPGGVQRDLYQWNGTAFELEN